MGHKYTAEEKTWLFAQDVSLTYEEVTKRFNEKFGCVVGVSALQQHITKALGKNHVRKNASEYHFYTEEEKTWLINQDAEITYKELTEKFNEKFKCKRTESQIKDLMCKRLKIVSRTGNIEKGFFTGKEPIYKIGEEVIRDGYVYVKVKDECGENKTNWRRKQDVVWEKENGKIPEDKFVIFLDKNPMNCKIENLYLVNRSIHAQMCREGFYSTNPELTIVAIKSCELLAKLKEAPSDTKDAESEE